MTVTRIWLTNWEWDCCGTAFAVGDRVVLNTSSQVDPWFAEMLGNDLADGIDAVETHHDDPGPDAVAGIVEAIHGVTLAHTVRREPRPADAPRPEPLALGEGVWAVAGSRDPWITVSEPVPGSASLVPAPHVPWPARGAEPDEHAAPPPGLAGYLVDVTVE